MGRVCSALVVCVALAGCTRLVDPPNRPPGIPVSPITAGQVADLLSKKIQQGDGNFFTTVDPPRCDGIAREVDPSFIFDHRPVATHGGHWVAPGTPEVHIEEMVGVFRANFDPDAALAAAERTIRSCQGVAFTVTSMGGRTYVFELMPPQDSGSPDIVLWSFQSADWACDSAFVAAHNAAIEISTCAEVGGYDVASLARDSLKRIDALANSVA